MSHLAASALLLAVLSLPAASATVSDAPERARIAAERQVVEARFEAARQACEARFVVNNCLEQARQERRQALEPLQRQTHLLDDARRRERAVERLRSIQARESAAAAMPALQAASATPPAASGQRRRAAAAAAPCGASGATGIGCRPGSPPAPGPAPAAPAGGAGP
jgi:hypothetical protein